MKIERATLKDCEQIAELVWIILEDMELSILNDYPKKQIINYLIQAMQDENYRYSPRRIWVAKDNDKVVGLAASYFSKDEEIVDDAWKKIMNKEGVSNLFDDKESFAEEWYLDSLVVDNDYRGLGIAKQLITYVCEEARESGKRTVGLNVDQKNKIAYDLYKKIGFQIVGQKVLSNHIYHHLQIKI